MFALVPGFLVPQKSQFNFHMHPSHRTHFIAESTTVKLNKNTEVNTRLVPKLFF